MNFLTAVKGFFKKETVLTISLVLALVSMAFVAPDGQYAQYIDYRTLSILLSLMTVMCGLRSLGVFGRIGRWMLDKTGTVRSLTVVLVLLCFVFSMVITNDVALITFVPFTIEVLGMAGLESYLVPIIVLQTIAANLGSMLTPIGNPQNLYLYSLSGMSLGQFLALLLPSTLLSLVGLMIASLILTKPEAAQIKLAAAAAMTSAQKRQTLIYGLLFLLALTTVARVLPYYIVLAVILLAVLVTDRATLKGPDYALLFTFIFLFVFIGNMKRIPAVNLWLSGIVQGRELLTAVAASQVISNVPAAILLSGFTDNLRALILGTNIGGLGTIIASMASLISFKFYGQVPGSQKGRYLGVFTLWNLIFLAVLLPFALLLYR